MFLLYMYPAWVLDALVGLANTDSTFITVSLEALLSFAVFGAAQAIVILKWGYGISGKISQLSNRMESLEALINEKLAGVRSDVDDHEERIRIVERER